MEVARIRSKLRRLGNARDARILSRFFKTGPGEYGAGDVFWGIRVPALRQMVREVGDVERGDLLTLLRDPVHEVRLFALLVMVGQYERGTASERAAIYRAYLAHARWINNWDLVDLSAPNIVGAHLLTRSRAGLDRLAKSPLLWRRRIAIVATYALIRRGEFADTFRIAERLLSDPEPLIHKATGWMLREVGKRDVAALRAFLDAHGLRMPRTALRYAIERFPETTRKAYLARST